MALFDRITSDGDSGSPEKLTVHGFCNGMTLYLVGDVTLSKMTSTFSLSAGDLAEVASIKAAYGSLSTNLKKLQFMAKIEAVFGWAESGDMTEEEAKALLGF